MNADFVAVFEASRAADNHIGRLVRSEVENMPPSKAHIKRLARIRPVVTKSAPKTGKISQLPDTILLHKQLLADLGGSRVVAPSHDGTLYNAAQRGILAHVAPIANSDAVPAKETDPTFRERKRLYLATKQEFAKVRPSCEHQLSLLDVMEFGE